MMRFIRMLLTAVSGLMLLGTELPAQSPGFVFEDATTSVGFVNQQGGLEYKVKVFDNHVTGAAFVDLTGDGYPDLVLPANRNTAKKPEDQDLGGLLLVRNIADASGPGGRKFGFTTANANGPIFKGHETVGVVAFDYDSDGDLDLLMICSGDDGAANAQNFADKITMGLNKKPANPMRNILLRNDGSSGGELPTFTDVTAETDPIAPDPAQNVPGLGDGSGLAYTQAPSSITPDDPNSMDIDNDPWVEDPGSTTFPRSSACAAVADVNRDGRLDVFIGNGPQGDMSRGFTGQMDALYLNGGPNANGDWIFWDVTYDRTQYPFFAPMAVAGERCPGVHWNGYIPVFGSQDENGNFIMPQGEPWLRFSATIAAGFTDLNNDGWPDLIVTNKGWNGNSVFFPASVTSNDRPWAEWLDQTMVYINRGNDPQGKWLGFWPRTWDLFLQQDPSLAQVYKRDGAPMGIALGDYNADGRSDYVVTDVSLAGPDLIAAQRGDPGIDIHMGDLIQVNQTADGDLSLASDGDEVIQPGGNGTDPSTQNLHGVVILPIWFSWGIVLVDMDNDGDLDVYACCKSGATGTDPLVFPVLLGNKKAFDRFFENQLIQDPLSFQDPIDKTKQMRDLNPAPYLPPLGNTPVWRKESRNVLQGDLDLDGFTDLLVLPAAGGGTTDTVIFYHNITGSDPAAHPGIRVVLEDPNNVCPLCNRFAVGARVLVEANLDGSMDGSFEKQYAELHVGEGNGASTHSYPLEFGLGAHDPDPNADGDFTVKVTWPCGFTQTESIDPLAILNQPKPAKGLVSIAPQAHTHSDSLLGISFQTPDQADPSYPSGMNPLVIPITVSGPVALPGGPPIPANVPAVELSLRKAGTTDPFVPFSMAHGRPNGSQFEPQVIPLRLASDHDVDDLPIDTFYEVKVRARGPSGEAIQTKSTTAMATQLLIRPDKILGGDSRWDHPNSGGDIVLAPGMGGNPGQSENLNLVFPGATDFVAYDLVVSVKSDQDGGQLKVTMSKMGNNPPVLTVDTATQEHNFGANDQAVVSPTPSFGDVLTFQNTGTTNLTIHYVTIARRP